MDSSASDHKSIASSRRRGREGIGSLLGRYRSYLLLLARAEVGKRLQSKVDASDLVQETLMDAHRNFDRFEGQTEAQLIAWLKAILAGNVAKTLRHYLGTARRDLRREIENDLTTSLACADRDLRQVAGAGTERPSQCVIKDEQAAAVAEAVQNLPPDYRQVMILRHW